MKNSTFDQVLSFQDAQQKTANILSLSKGGAVRPSVAVWLRLRSGGRSSTHLPELIAAVAAGIKRSEPEQRRSTMPSPGSGLLTFSLAWHQCMWLLHMASKTQWVKLSRITVSALIGWMSPSCAAKKSTGALPVKKLTRVVIVWLFCIGIKRGKVVPFSELFGDCVGF